MESGQLEVTVLAAKDLKNVKHVGKMNPYAVVSIGDEHSKRINTAKKRGSDPEWNTVVQFDVVQNDPRSLSFEIKHDGTLYDREIGQVHVPLEELLRGGASGEAVSYEVKSPSGELQGEIVISYKFTPKPNLAGAEASGDAGADPGKTAGPPVKEDKKSSVRNTANNAISAVANNVISAVANRVKLAVADVKSIAADVVKNDTADDYKE